MDWESVTWVVWALRTITSEHKALQQISIHVVFPLDELNDIRLAVNEDIYQHWKGLDSILFQICQSGVCRLRTLIYHQNEWGVRVYRDGGAMYKQM